MSVEKALLHWWLSVKGHFTLMVSGKQNVTYFDYGWIEYILLRWALGTMQHLQTTKNIAGVSGYLSEG